MNIIPRTGSDAELAAILRGTGSWDEFRGELPPVLRAWRDAAVAAKVREHNAERDLIHEDMRELLRALGMFDGARPESPREVMRMASVEAARLRAKFQERDRP